MIRRDRNLAKFVLALSLIVVTAGSRGGGRGPAAGAAPPPVSAGEGYTPEFEQCASATYTVVPPTATITPTRTRTPTPLPGVVVPVTWTPTFTPSVTPAPGCVDGITLISPLSRDDLSGVGVATADLVMEVVMAEPTTPHILVYL